MHITPTGKIYKPPDPTGAFMMNSATSGISVMVMVIHPTKKLTTMVTTMGRRFRYSKWNTGLAARRSTSTNATKNTTNPTAGATTSSEASDAPKLLTSMFCSASSNNSTVITISTDPGTSSAPSPSFLRFGSTRAPAITSTTLIGIAK